MAKKKTIKIDPKSFGQPVKADELIKGELYTNLPDVDESIFEFAFLDKDGDPYFKPIRMQKGEYIESKVYPGHIGYTSFAFPDYNVKLL